MSRKLLALAAVVAILVVGLAACAAPTPQVVEKEKVVEKLVVQTVVVEKEKVVEKLVVQTVVVEKEKVVEKPVVQTVVVEKEKVVEKVITATPVPKGGDLVVAIRGGSEPAVLDAHIDPYWSAGMISGFTSDYLVCQDHETMEFKPHLAKSWDVSDDAVTWTFHLREDVMFQDGTPFNAEAVKYNIERILDPETQSNVSAVLLSSVESVEVVDEYIVRITHDRPNVAFLFALAHQLMPIYSPAALEKYGVEEFSKHLVGSGPFTLKEWVPNDHVTVVKWPDYNWPPACVDHTGPAYLDSITIRWIDEAAVRAGIVKTGEVHVADLPVQYASDYAVDPDYQLLSGFSGTTGLGWQMNVARPPLDDIRVRKAILYAVDRDSINKMLYAGMYRPVYSAIGPTVACYWEGAETLYPHDLDKANALLEEAGWEMNPATAIREKDGQPLKMRWTCLHHEEIGEVLKAQLQEVGIDLTVEKVAGPIQIDLTTRRDFELMYQRWGGIGDPAAMEDMFHSKNSEPGGWAWGGFTDEKLDEVFDKAKSEADPEKRCEYYVEAQKIIMENAIRLPILMEPKMWVLDKSVKGFILKSYPAIFYCYTPYIEK